MRLTVAGLAKLVKSGKRVLYYTRVPEHHIQDLMQLGVTSNLIFDHKNTVETNRRALEIFNNGEGSVLLTDLLTGYSVKGDVYIGSDIHLDNFDYQMLMDRANRLDNPGTPHEIVYDSLSEAFKSLDEIVEPTKEVITIESYLKHWGTSSLNLTVSFFIGNAPAFAGDEKLAKTIGEQMGDLESALTEYYNRIK